MPTAPLTADEFRQSMGRFASGVTIISVLHGSERKGMTASAFISVSLTPPLILVSVDKKAHMHAYLLEAQRFGVSILSAQQRALSDHFAGRMVGGQKVEAEVSWFDHEGLPLIGGSVAQLVCAKYSQQDVGDHTLFVGEVLYSRYTDDDPLLHFRGAYHELA